MQVASCQLRIASCQLRFIVSVHSFYPKVSSCQFILFTPKNNSFTNQSILLVRQKKFMLVRQADICPRACVSICTVIKNLYTFKHRKSFDKCRKSCNDNCFTFKIQQAPIN